MRKPTPLKLAVVASGITQNDIAAADGVHEVTFSRYVTGGYCDDATRQKIAKALGRGVGELWPGHDGASKHTPEHSGTSSEIAA